ncbi:hypothetical protein [Mycobacterium ostraviense]|uniref:hypothetical protein n=1 Tax=Mycobacterium ostraviense TaxID=2738409 RepID=UPI0011563260|nr:hypothetical protein [Mycobacterium ostraviense]UGT92480.1 hypothetical protein LTS72_03440 [Mycobacterium ostraviense]
MFSSTTSITSRISDSGSTRPATAANLLAEASQIHIGEQELAVPPEFGGEGFTRPRQVGYSSESI